MNLWNQLCKHNILAPHQFLCQTNHRYTFQTIWFQLQNLWYHENTSLARIASALSCSRSHFWTDWTLTSKILIALSMAAVLTKQFTSLVMLILSEFSIQTFFFLPCLMIYRSKVVYFSSLNSIQQCCENNTSTCSGFIVQ